MHLPVNIGCAEKDSCGIFKVQKVLNLLTQKKLFMILWGKVMQTERQKINDGLLLQAQRTWPTLSWVVKKQVTVALSSSEAEYQGMAAAVQEALYLKRPLEDFDIQQKHPIAIGEDNKN